MDDLIEDYKSLSEEIQTLKEIRTAKIEQVESVYEDKKDAIEKRQKHILTQLRVMADAVPQKETKTQYKVELLSGSIVIKKPQKTLVADKSKLIEWAKENCMHEYLDEKIVESFKWQEMKSDLAIVDEMGENTIINQQTGEILNIDGLTVEIKPEEVVIK